MSFSWVFPIFGVNFSSFFISKNNSCLKPNILAIIFGGNKSIKLLESAKRAADQFIDYFDTIVDLNERDQNGKPVFSAEKVMKEMSQLHKVHEELITLED